MAETIFFCEYRSNMKISKKRINIGHNDVIHNPVQAISR